MFRNSKGNSKTTPLMVLKVTNTQKINGVLKNTYEQNGDIIYCNFSSYGGTEKIVDGNFAIEDTAQIITWFRPDITSECRLKRLSDNAVFEIIGEPENLEMRNFELSFKIRRTQGGA